MGLLAWVAAVFLIALASLASYALYSNRRYEAYHRREGIPLELRPFGEALRYDLRLLGAIVVAGWWLVRAAGRDGLWRPRGAPSGPPVLCVHGFLMTGTCMWGLRRELLSRGRPSRAVFLGWPHRSIEDYAPPLERVMREMLDVFSGERLDIVAHSMGGLVLRALLARHPDLGRRLRRIVTLGTPHFGTAASAGVWGASGIEVRQMAPGAPFLATLPDFRATAPGADVVTLAARRDLVVFPHPTAHLPGADPINLAGVSHLGLLTNRDAIRASADRLCAADPPYRS